MKSALLLFGLAGLIVPIASAGTVSYNTTGSTLSCNGTVGCVQNTSTSVTDGGITLTYNAGSGSGVVTPSIINFGNIDSTGAGISNITGILLTININSTPPGGGGTLPNGAISGLISTNNSSATILNFSPNNTTTGFGTLPGVTIAGVRGVYVPGS